MMRSCLDEPTTCARRRPSHWMRPRALAPPEARFDDCAACNLQAEEPLSEFLEDFPSVSKKLAIAASEQAKNRLIAAMRPA